MDTPQTYTVRVGFGTQALATALLVGLKLTGLIAWSWWWVLLPLYGPVVLLLAALLLGVVLLGTAKDNPFQ